MLGARRILQAVLVTMVLAVLVVSVASARGEASTDSSLNEDDLLILRVSEAILRLFDDGGAGVWSGYSLARQPFMVYVPERWALVFNAGSEAEGFTVPPDGWRLSGHDALYHEGKYDDLAGQLAFNVPVGDTATVALGFPEGMSDKIENAAGEAFAYVVHEAFHQYQYSAFGETPWEREERYPIADTENAARAWLEMRVLEDAVDAMESGDDDVCSALTSEFVALRTRRWAYASPFVERYEQGKELLEGTAKYVELRCVNLMEGLDYVSAIDGRPDPLANAFPPASTAHLIADELEQRRGETALEPQDIPRNRIYAVAGAEALLLDHFEVDWKPRAESESAEFVYADLLRERLGLDEAPLAEIADAAETSYGYAEALASAKRAWDEYQSGYASALAAFESQDGIRIEVAFGSQGVSRSRSSRADKWLMDEGRVTLCPMFGVYTLRADGWNFELRDAGLLETNDWDAGTKEVLFYAGGPESVAIDGTEFSGETGGERAFESIAVSGPGFRLTSDLPGTVEITGKSVRVELDNAH